MTPCSVVIYPKKGWAGGSLSRKGTRAGTRDRVYGSSWVKDLGSRILVVVRKSVAGILSLYRDTGKLIRGFFPTHPRGCARTRNKLFSTFSTGFFRFLAAADKNDKNEKNVVFVIFVNKTSDEFRAKRKTFKSGQWPSRPAGPAQKVVQKWTLPNHERTRSEVECSYFCQICTIWGPGSLLATTFWTPFTTFRHIVHICVLLRY